MLELLKGQTATVNKILQEEKMSYFGLGSVSAIDRSSNIVSIRPDGLESESFGTGNMLLISLSNGNILEGKCERPKDLFLHLSIYKNFPRVNAIAHVYPKWLSTYAQAGKNIPILGSTHAAQLRRGIPCTRMLTEAESKNSFFESVNKTVIEALQNCEEFDHGGVMIRYDGALAFGLTPWKALENAKAMEKIAEAAWCTEAICKDGPCLEMPAPIAGQYYEAAFSDGDTNGSCGKPGSQISLVEKQQICLDMLIYFDKVCRANGIKYSLTGGTLLGAVRHGGFIPWDDDADVFLARPEFNKLEAVLGNGDQERYTYVTRKREKKFSFVYGRLIDTKTMIEESSILSSMGKGIFLDVCVVDGLPNNWLLRQLHIACVRFLFRARRAVVHEQEGRKYPSNGVMIVFLKKLLYRFTSPEFWLRWLEKVVDKYSFEKSTYVGNFTSQYGKREMLKKSVFDSYFDVSFENHKFMVCQGYKEYLNNIFGKNYMNLPAKSKRKGHHPSTAHWVE